MPKSKDVETIPLWDGKKQSVSDMHWLPGSLNEFGSPCQEMFAAMAIILFPSLSRLLGISPCM